MDAPSTLSAKPSPWRRVPCPATSYHERQIHWARWHRGLRFWTCEHCGLSGTEAGFLRLVELAIERFDLATSYAFWEPPGRGGSKKRRDTRPRKPQPRPPKG